MDVHYGRTPIATVREPLGAPLPNKDWFGIELRHLAALAAVQEERSFRGAAERLGYVQSAISQQIARLERLVGTRLVERSRGHAPPVHLTKAGELLLTHGARIAEQLDAAAADLRSLASEESPTLRVGVIECVATRLLSSALIELRRMHPALSVEVEASSDERSLFARVTSGALDVAFAELPLPSETLEGVVVLTDPCVLLVPSGSPRAIKGPPTRLADLVGDPPLIRVKGWRTHELIESQLRAAGLEPDVTLSADTNATVQALVGAGCGAAILPRLAVDDNDPSVTTFDISDLVAGRRLALYWHTRRRRCDDMNAFRIAVCRAADRLGESWERELELSLLRQTA